MRTALRMVLAVIVAVALIAAPLVLVQRAQCPQGDRFQDEWSVRLPFQEEFRPGCREPQTAGERLLELLRGE